MSYWGSKPIENDCAFTSIGAIISIIKQRMFEDIEVVLEDPPYPEQSILAHLQCLRILAQQFPQSVNVHFGKKSLQKSKAAFDQWYSLVEKKIPAKHREAVLLEAQKEFELCEKQFGG